MELNIIFLDRDFDSTTTEITFNSSLSSQCIEISTSLDSLIEGPETFSVAFEAVDPAVSSGDNVVVTIEDRNEREVLLSFAELAYRMPEGETVMVCVEVTSDNIGNLERDVGLSLMTISGGAQGGAQGSYSVNYTIS